MATLDKAFGYQGNVMNLPVHDVAASLPFYEGRLGFTVSGRNEIPPRSAVLTRDNITMALVENGGDPSQDGVAFHVRGVDALHAEFTASGLQKELSAFRTEERGGVPWKVFFVVAPDGLCYWFGEPQAS